MKSDQLIISLSKLDRTRLISILNIRPNELNELSETLRNLLMALEEISALNPREIPAEQQGLHGTPTSPVSPLSSHQCQRRLTRANSIDTETDTSTSKRYNGSDELFAVNKLIVELSGEPTERSRFFQSSSLSSTRSDYTSYGACGVSHYNVPIQLISR
jgi:hypothetical protein